MKPKQINIVSAATWGALFGLVITLGRLLIVEGIPGGGGGEAIARAVGEVVGGAIGGAFLFAIAAAVMNAARR
jgi:hypothetical protein